MLTLSCLDQRHQQHWLWEINRRKTPCTRQIKKDHLSGMQLHEPLHINHNQSEQSRIAQNCTAPTNLNIWIHEYPPASWVPGCEADCCFSKVPTCWRLVSESACLWNLMVKCQENLKLNSRLLVLEHKCPFVCSPQDRPKAPQDAKIATKSTANYNVGYQKTPRSVCKNANLKSWSNV